MCTMHISTAFDAGSIEVVCTEDGKATLRLCRDPSKPISRPSLSAGAALEVTEMQWFYFRAISLEKDIHTEFEVTNACDATYVDAWVGYRVCASYDRKSWFHIDATSFDGTVLSWIHRSEFSSCFYALREPYTKERSVDFAAGLESKNPDLVSLQLAGKSPNMNPIEVIHIIRPQPAQAMIEVDHSKIPQPGPTSALTQKPIPPPRKRNSVDILGKTSQSTSASHPKVIQLRSINASQSATQKVRSSIHMETLARNPELEALRREVLKQTQLRSGTKNMINVLNTRAHGGKKRKRKLENELNAYDVKINGLHLQLRALCTDWWFGHTLVDFVDSTDRRLPLVVESCVNALKESGLCEEGIFRVPGDVAGIEKLKESFERAEDPLSDLTKEEILSKTHEIGSCLKQYLRELEDPVLTYEHYTRWIDLGKRMTEDDMDQTKDMLPEPHQDLLRFFIPFLSLVADHSDENKMTIENLARVFGPTLLRPLQEGDTSIDTMTNMLRDSQPQIYVTSFLIRNHLSIVCEETPRVPVKPIVAVNQVYSPKVKDKLPSLEPEVKIGPEDTGLRAVKDWKEAQYIDLDLSREEAEGLINDIGEDGVFLFRASTGSTVGLSYTITFQACGEVHNHRLQMVDGMVVVEGVSFKSIKHMVEHYQHNPLFDNVKLKYPANRDALATIEHAIASGKTRSQAIEGLSQVWEAGSIYNLTSPCMTQIPRDALEPEAQDSSTIVPQLNVWIIGRQQAAASHACFLIEGLVDRIIDTNDAVSSALLERMNFHIVPDLNPDGCERGFYRVNSLGIDLAASWFDGTGNSAEEVQCIRSLMDNCPPDIWIDVQSIENAAGAVAPNAWMEATSAAISKRELHEEFSRAFARINPDFIGSDVDLMSNDPLGGCAFAVKTFGCFAFSFALPLQSLSKSVGLITSGRYRKLGASVVDVLYQTMHKMKQSSSSSV